MSVVDIFLGTVSFVWSYTIGKALLVTGTGWIVSQLWLIYRHKNLLYTSAVERETIGYGNSREEAEQKAKRIAAKQGIELKDERKTKTTTTWIFGPDDDPSSISVRQREPKMAGSPKKNEYKVWKKK